MANKAITVTAATSIPRPGIIMKEAPEGTQTYDFGQEGRSPRRQIRFVQDVVERTAELMSDRLTVSLSLAVRSTLKSVSHATLGTYCDNAADHTVAVVFTCEPLPPQGVMFIDCKFAFEMVDRLLGGSGETKEEPRPLTRVEQGVIEDSVLGAVAAVCSGWREAVVCNIAVERIETASRLIHVAYASETMIVADLEARVRGASHRIAVAFPTGMLDSLMHFLVAPVKKVSTADARPSEETKAWVMATSVDVVCRFHPNTTRVREVLAMEAGDIVRLDHVVGTPVFVDVNGICKLSARYGVKSGKRAAQIV